jgi:hypothetical protein
MLTIPKDVLDTLHALRAQQLAQASPYGEEFVGDNPVVILTLGLGDELYLGLDGGVFIREFPNDGDVHETTDPRHAASGLVIAARRYGLPELLSIRPPRPAAASVCANCGGRGWVGFEDTNDGGGPSAGVWDWDGWREDDEPR